MRNRRNLLAEIQLNSYVKTYRNKLLNFKPINDHVALVTTLMILWILLIYFLIFLLYYVMLIEVIFMHVEPCYAIVQYQRRV